MRPTPSPTTNIWSTPIPYLFGSLALLLLLIAISILILLLCSYKNHHSSSSSSNNNSNDGLDLEKPPLVLKVLDPEPKVVVIMAGDQNPTFMAFPTNSINKNEEVKFCQCHLQDQVI